MEDMYEITRGKSVSTEDELQTQLEEHLESGRDWEEMETPIPGVFVARFPETKKKPPLLYLGINPIDEQGKRIKRRALFVGNLRDFYLFREIFANEQSERIMIAIDNTNPERSKFEKKRLKL